MCERKKYKIGKVVICIYIVINKFYDVICLYILIRK